MVLLSFCINKDIDEKALTYTVILSILKHILLSDSFLLGIQLDVAQKATYIYIQPKSAASLSVTRATTKVVKYPAFLV